MSAAASEAAAPAVAKWLYGTSDPKKLNADQKQTIASIFGAASFAIGSRTGSTTNAIATSQLGENAVANNYLTLKQKETFSRAMRVCKSNGKQDNI
ncbi:VENN motif pre-toxin domain-containing protein [Marinomonas spartinae]|uniref:VENN motif pre-toxin domain-containing protein n=1 Tax=Marinomonas spartinae TaxID=1792290 RepID=UPI0018F27924|nr:VENN motif pre-toxin domain-containing protein [Marinomonas spartinae]MBJ7553943.1 VENN motif pre-toxin domain-containing protein [Marinomonas spartinae]